MIPCCPNELGEICGDGWVKPDPDLQDLRKFALARVDAAIAEADRLLELQREVCGPAPSLEVLKAALVHVDANIGEIAMLSLCGSALRGAPVSPATIMEQLLELRRQIEARIHRRECGENET